MVHGIENIVAMNNQVQAEFDKDDRELRGKIRSVLEEIAYEHTWDIANLSTYVDRIVEVFNS